VATIQGSVSSIVDSQGIFSSAAVSNCDFAQDCAYIYDSLSLTGGSETVSVSYSGILASTGLYLLEISGVVPSGATRTGTGTGCSSSFSCIDNFATSPISFSSGSFLLAMIGDGDGSFPFAIRAGAGFTGLDAAPDAGGEYSTTVTSPTTFPASALGGYGAGWAEAGISLAPTGTASDTVALSCSPSPVAPKLPTTCTGTVSGSTAPTGYVFFSSSGSGTFSSNYCELNPISGSKSQCDVTYTPPTVSSPVTITAKYGGDSNYESNSAAFQLNVIEPGPPPSMDLGNVTVYSSNDSAPYLLVTATATISNMHSGPFYEAIFPQFGYLSTGTWGYLGYYEGTFAAVSGGQQGLVVTISVTFDDTTLTGSLVSPAAGSSNSTSFVFR
jgi:hypothetical protein